MTRWVALLRGVNVGGNKKVAMSDLRAVVEHLGHEDVKTYVQSGNVLFSASSSTTATALERRIEQAIEAEIGVSTKVLVRSGTELTSIVRACPFGEAAATDPTKVHVGFLSAAPDKRKLAAVDPSTFAPDEVAPGKRVLYFHHPNGMAGSQMKVDWGKTLDVVITSRNWRTVTTLAEMAASS